MQQPDLFGVLPTVLSYTFFVFVLISQLLMDEGGANPWHVDSVLGQNAVHIACQAGCVESVRFVLDFFNDRQRYTTAEHNMPEVNEFVNMKTSKFGLTPLHYVLKIPEQDPRRGDVYETLMSAGADPFLIDSHGRTPM